MYHYLRLKLVVAPISYIFSHMLFWFYFYLFMVCMILKTAFPKLMLLCIWIIGLVVSNLLAEFYLGLLLLLLKTSAAISSSGFRPVRHDVTFCRAPGILSMRNGRLPRNPRHGYINTLSHLRRWHKSLFCPWPRSANFRRCFARTEIFYEQVFLVAKGWHNVSAIPANKFASVYIVQASN